MKLQNIKVLISQNLFDDKGPCYDFALRNGVAHSSIDPNEMMETNLKLFLRTLKNFSRQTLPKDISLWMISETCEIEKFGDRSGEDFCHNRPVSENLFGIWGD